MNESEVIVETKFHPKRAIHSLPHGLSTSPGIDYITFHTQLGLQNMNQNQGLLEKTELKKKAPVYQERNGNPSCADPSGALHHEQFLCRDRAGDEGRFGSGGRHLAPREKTPSVHPVDIQARSANHRQTRPDETRVAFGLRTHQRALVTNVCLLIFVSAYPTDSKPVIIELSNVSSTSENVQTPMTEKNEPRDVKNAALANMAMIGETLQEDTDDAAMASSVNGEEVLARFVKEDPEEDMEVAEAVVFRPLFRYRQRQRKYGNSGRRRYYSYYG
uniref:(California timema) hypothetical protein n=1 Tax=Timema californicum TaxID=61474 RepID=A0A7R9P6L0_TIMCA|nr:unnamed protein product [Timema californicum]